MPASKRLNPKLDTTAFGQGIDKSVDSLKSIPGLYYHRFELDHEAPADSPESVAAFLKTVQKGTPEGGEWDAHFFGAGLRLVPALTPLFEELVNIVVAEGKGKPKILFR